MMNDGMSYISNRMDTPAVAPGPIPNTDSVASLKRDDRKSAATIAKYYTDQLQRGIEIRRTHAIRWMQVLSILNGIHYFNIDAFGRWIPFGKPKDQRKVRAIVPMMTPYYRWEHGRFSNNQIGAISIPPTGGDRTGFYQANMAQDVMNQWCEEADIESVDDEANQQLLVYGLNALYNEKVPWRQQTYLRTFPGCELLPIPYDSRNWSEMDGVMRVLTVSTEWLEMQDEVHERRTGKKPARPMARLAQSQTVNMHSRFTGFSTNVQWNSKFSGATCSWIWRKPTQLNPYGETLFMVEDELFAYVSGQDEQGRMIALQNGEIPLKPIYYIKEPHDWFGSGFCEQLISPQLEANRQMSAIIESANINRGFLGFNSEYIDVKDIQNSIDGLIAFKSPNPEDKVPPLIAAAPPQTGREIGAVINIVHEYARRAIGYESDIIFGQQEGRTEGGPATNTLNSNAHTPIQSVLNRKWRAYRSIFPAILDDIKEVWPEQKQIKVLGIDGLVRQKVITRGTIPNSANVQILPTPFVVNGRNGLVNMLFQLRQIPSDDPNVPIVTSRELRRSLSIMGMAPPGLEMYDKTEQRIKWRISQLINDGQQPAIPSAMQDPGPQQVENHRMAIELLREAMLDPSAMLYSQQVHQVLGEELNYHLQMSGNIRPPDNFDNDADLHDMRVAENNMEAAEANPETAEGLFAPGGIPL